MKKLINILLMAILCIAYAGCSDDNDDASSSSLKVVKADTVFDAGGGSGTITVSATGSVTAKSDESWCTATASGNAVNVSVNENVEPIGRTALISISSSEGLLVVRVTQSGAIFWIKNFRDGISFESSGGTIASAVVSNLPLTLVSKPEWVTYRYENDSIFLTSTPSTNPRKGSITLTNGPKTVSYEVMQLSYNSLLGEWQMIYNTTPTSTIPTTLNVVFNQSATPNQYDVTGLPLDATLRIRFNNTDKTLNIYPSQDMGPDPNTSGRRLSLLIYSSDGYITWGESIHYTGVWDDSIENTTFVFGDNGSWADKTIVGLYGVSSTVLPVASGTYTAISNIRYFNLAIARR